MDTYDFNSRPSIAVSVGDPSGIGPEVSLKALVDAKVRNLAQWILVGDAWQLHEIDQHIGSLSGHRVTDVGEVTPDMDVVILDTDQLDRRDYVLGQVSAACGQAGLAYVRTAAELCLADKTAAMVTARDAFKFPLCSGDDPEKSMVISAPLISILTLIKLPSSKASEN